MVARLITNFTVAVTKSASHCLYTFSYCSKESESRMAPTEWTNFFSICNSYNLGVTSLSN